MVIIAGWTITSPCVKIKKIKRQSMSGSGTLSFIKISFDNFLEER